MGTNVIPEVSKKNRYWISKHRYYELKHFCLQYPEWKKELLYLEPKMPSSLIQVNKNKETKDIVSDIVLKRLYLQERISLIEKISECTDNILGSYILKAVTEGLSFNYLKTVLDIPCERDMYYDRYRKFYWLLSKNC